MKSQPVCERPRYRKPSAQLFTDEKIFGVPPIGKLVGCYLLIGQVNRVGLFVFSAGRAQEELGLSPKVFNSNFELVLTTLGWRFDRAVRVLYIPTWWRYNAPDNPNVLLAALDDLNGLPNTPLLNEFATNVQYLPRNHVEPFRQRLGERYGERLGVQESGLSSSNRTQEQETPPSPPAGGRSAGRGFLGKGSISEDVVPVDLILNTWNSLPCVHRFEGQPGKNTCRRLKRLWKEHPELQWFVAYFQRIAGTPELTGSLESGFQASLTWALTQENIEKVLGGHYGEPHPIEQED